MGAQSLEASMQERQKALSRMRDFGAAIYLANLCMGGSLAHADAPPTQPPEYLRDAVAHAAAVGLNFSMIGIRESWRREFVASSPDIEPIKFSDVEWSGVNVSGASQMLDLQVENSTIWNAIQELADKFKFRFESEKPLDYKISNSFHGNLKAVISEVLKGESFSMFKSNSGHLLKVYATAPVAQTNDASDMKAQPKLDEHLSEEPIESVVYVTKIKYLETKLQKLTLLLERKTTEVEILKDALEEARKKALLFPASARNEMSQ
jgi:hypothetical protein